VYSRLDQSNKLLLEMFIQFFVAEMTSMAMTAQPIIVYHPAMGRGLDDETTHYLRTVLARFQDPQLLATSFRQNLGWPV
jgi:hypothetical protein